MDDRIVDLFQIPESGLLVIGTYEPGLVILSILIAILSSFVALHSISYSSVFISKLGKQLAICIGGLAMGIGVWSMHFLGMLAFDLCTLVTYDPMLTLLSIFPSAGACWIALNFISSHQSAKKSLPISGLLVGVGIGSMHYIGMAAMTMAPLLRYDLSTFSLSIAVAVLLAMLSLWIRFYIGNKLKALNPLFINVLAASVMGAAISGMHYTGMAAARFVLPPGIELDPQPSNISELLAYGLAAATLFVAFIVLAITMITKYKILSMQYRSSEQRMHTIMDSAVDGIITIDKHGTVVSVNKATTSLLGWDPSDLLGDNVNKIVPLPLRHNHDQFIKQYLLTKQPKVIGSGRDVEALHKDGSKIAVRLSIGHAALPDQDYFVAFLSDLRQRLKMESSLKLNEKKFRTLVTNIPGVAYRRTNASNSIMLYVSDAIENLTGYSAETFLNKEAPLSFISLMEEADVKKIEQCLNVQNPEQVVEYRIKDRGGNIRWITDSFRLCQDENGDQYIDGFMMDSTKRVEDTAMIERYKSLVESSEDAIISLSPNGMIQTWNDAAYKLYGLTSEEVIGQSAALLFSDHTSHKTLIKKVLEGQSIRHFRSSVCAKDGTITFISVSISPVFDGDQHITGISMISRNVTHEVEQEASIKKQAIEDPLTNLLNRAGLQEKMAEFISNGELDSQKHGFALFFIDLDNFKYYNDTYGHDLGDLLLNEVALILKRHLSENDLAGRLGGDEFVVCLLDPKSSSDVEKAANSIISSITKITALGSTCVSLSASMGVAQYPKHGNSLSEMFKAADEAMYCAKNAGKNQVCFHVQGSNQSPDHSFSTELNDAIDNGELELFFQPILHAHSGRIFKAETLLRWNHPRLGRLTPDHFIAMAEKTGLIQKVGRWVENEALRYLQKWTRLFGDSFQLAINKSALELSDSEYGAKHLKASLAKNNLSGRNLIIEITEHSMLENCDATQSELEQYREMGVQIALDDFGTGFSSLVHLKQYPVNYLKIDKSFVFSLTNSNVDYCLCKGAIQLASLLKIAVVAEGVETTEQYNLLTQLDCDYIQGYLISKPLPAAQFAAKVTSHNQSLESEGMVPLSSAQNAS